MTKKDGQERMKFRLARHVNNCLWIIETYVLVFYNLADIAFDIFYNIDA